MRCAGWPELERVGLSLRQDLELVTGDGAVVLRRSFHVVAAFALGIALNPHSHQGIGHVRVLRELVRRLRLAGSP
jgi:hypothetical protein